jgi:hypothetical protein
LSCMECAWPRVHGQALRLDPKAGAFTWLWSTSGYPGVDVQGFMAVGAKPGSLVLSNWEGLYYFE